MGIDEVPIAQNLMAHTFVKENAGGGIHIYNDATGPSRRTGVSSTFSYQLKTGKRSKISFGFIRGFNTIFFG